MNDEVFVFVAFFSAVAFVVYTLVNLRMRRLQLKAVSEFNIRLLDRIGSVKDFSDFVQTEGGAKFMNSLTVAAPAREAGSSSGHRIITASQIGVVLSMMGLGFLALQGIVGGSGAYGFTVVGVVALSIGLGFLISAGTSYWLAKQLGVLGVNGDTPR